MASERKPIFKVTYNATDITEDISDDVESIRYEDEVDGTANEIVIVVDDMSGKWKNSWMVNIGATLEVEIGFESDNMLDCGSFGIDEIQFKGEPDKVEIRALSVGEANSLRDVQSYVYENQTIRQIIEQIADRNDMNVSMGALYAKDALTTAHEKRVLNMVIGRAVQDRESDGQFLHRITSRYGLSYVFGTSQEEGVERVLHVFVRMTIDTLDPVAKLAYPEVRNPSETEEKAETDAGVIILKSYDLKSKASSNVNEVEVNYHDPQTQELYQFAVDYDALPPAGKINPLQSDLNSFQRKEAEYMRVENKQQAEIIGIAKLYDIISDKVTGDMTMEGDPMLIAGNSFTVEGIGLLSGQYTIKKSTHDIKRKSGWITSLEVKMIKPN